MTFPRSAFRAITASQIFRTAPIARQPQHRQLGRRFYASGKGYKEYLSSNIPWSVSFCLTHIQFSILDYQMLTLGYILRLIGSIGLGGPMIVYLLRSRPKKKSHDERHGADHGVENEDTEKDEGHTEEQEVSGDKLVEQESKGEDTETQNAELKQSSSEIDEVRVTSNPMLNQPSSR